MNRTTALKIFSIWDQRGRHVFTLSDLVKLFPADSPKALQEGVNRLVRDEILERACRGVYVFAFANSRNKYTIEHIAKALRRGEYNYVSLESAMSEYGLISQIPIDRLTVITTGRKAEYHTPYGTIEFTHTKRNLKDILASMRDVQRPLRLATREAAWRDLKRIGRDIHLIDRGTLEDD